MHEETLSPEPPKPRFQFTVVHILVAPASIAVFFGLVTSAGWRAAYVFSGICGLAMLSSAQLRNDALYVSMGTLLLMVSVFLYLGASMEVHNVQQVTRACPIIILDREGNPIHAASICMREVDVMSLPADVPLELISAPTTAALGQSDLSGKATLAHSFEIQHLRGWFSKRPWYIVPDTLWVQVDAPGFQRTSVRLEPLVGKYHD